MQSKLIRQITTVVAFLVGLLTAEGRRLFSWQDVKEPRGYVGTRVTAVESRFVVYRFFGRLPIWLSLETSDELDPKSAIAMIALYGVHHYNNLKRPHPDAGAQARP